MGYIVGEVSLPGGKTPSEMFGFKLHDSQMQPSRRKPAGIPFGCWYGTPSKVTVARPRPDLDAYVNKLDSAATRFGIEMPTPKLGSDVRQFADLFFQHYFPKCDSNVNVMFDEWARHSKYPEKKIKELRELSKVPFLTNKHFKNNSFIKSEAYDDYKHPRGINAYSDTLKAVCGPIQHALDEAIYALPWCVKHQNVEDRPRLLKDLFGDVSVCGTDFTSMEAHHRGAYAGIRQSWKSWVGSNIPGIEVYLELINWKNFGVNYSSYKGITTVVEETLMSGDSSTSSDNLVLDMVLIFYIILKTKFGDPKQHVDKIKDIKALFEGDDGIFEQINPDPQLIIDMGIKLKIENYDNCGLASFCGIVADIEELVCVTDPKKILAGFGVLSPFYSEFGHLKKKALLRAKAMSYAVLYNNTPIIGELCQYVMRCTRSISIDPIRNRLDKYEYQGLERADKVWLKKPCVGLSTRKLVHQLYNISIEKQLEIEQYFRTAMTLKPFDFDIAMPDSWVDYASTYSAATSTGFELPIDREVDSWKLLAKRKMHYSWKYYPALYDNQGIYVVRNPSLVWSHDTSMTDG